MHFIPRHKPKSWVVFHLAFVGGIAAFLLMFFTSLPSGKGSALHFSFLISWAVCVVSGIVYGHGVLSGRYRDMQPKPWKEQVW